MPAPQALGQPTFQHWTALGRGNSTGPSLKQQPAPPLGLLSQDRGRSPPLPEPHCLHLCDGENSRLCSVPRFLDLINQHHLGELWGTSTVLSTSSLALLYYAVLSTITADSWLLHGYPFIPKSGDLSETQNVLAHGMITMLPIALGALPLLFTLFGKLLLLPFVQLTLPTWIKAPARGSEVCTPSPCTTCFTCDFTLLVLV